MEFAFPTALRGFQEARGKGSFRRKTSKKLLREVRLSPLRRRQLRRPEFVAAVKEKSLSSEVLESLTPAQQVIKIVNEEMVFWRQGEAPDLSGNPPAGLALFDPGLGKTPAAGKLALSLRKNGRRVMLVALGRLPACCPATTGDPG